MSNMLSSIFVTDGSSCYALQAGADPNIVMTKDAAGKPALALVQGSQQVLEKLVLLLQKHSISLPVELMIKWFEVCRSDSGSLLQIRTWNGSLVNWAVFKGHQQLVELLLQHYGRSNQLKEALSQLSECIYVVMLTAKKYPQQKMCSCLQHAVCSKAASTRSLLPLLLQSIRDSVSTKDAAELLDARNGGYAPLEWAAELGLPDCAAQLLAAGADPGAKRMAPSDTALHLAASWGHSSVLQLLLQHIKAKMSSTEAAAAIDAAAFSGMSPLMYAVDGGHKACVVQLLAAGANPGAKSMCNNTALHMAGERGHVGIVQVLLKHIKDNMSSKAAAAIIDAGKYNGSTPLMDSAERGRQKCVAQLLAADADPSAKNRYGTTALHQAAGRGHLGMVDMLLKHKTAMASINAVGSIWPRSKDPVLSGTPLMLAAAAGQQAVVKALIAAGAEIQFPKPLRSPEQQETAVKCVEAAMQELAAEEGQALQHNLTALLAQQQAAKVSGCGLQFMKRLQLSYLIESFIR